VEYVYLNILGEERGGFWGGGGGGLGSIPRLSDCTTLEQQLREFQRRKVMVLNTVKSRDWPHGFGSL
jgi:hypothetical protein